MTERFPDGTPIDPWFYQTDIPGPDSLGRQYVLTENGIQPDESVHTAEIQAMIDRAAENGGGVLVVPAGVFRTGALFFRPGVHLYVAEGGVLLGSDDISDYPVIDTRIEGESCRYFAALINADHCDGFAMLGPGTIDGNGLRSWKAFWLRRSWNPACTNKDEQRPRLVHISNSNNVLVAGLTMQNSHFWTNHLYRCRNVKYIGCRILSPFEPVKAPSTDAIDIDVCQDVLIRDCTMSVNDDAVVIKGGKGPWADTLPENGGSERILVEDCLFDRSHGCLTVGSEAVYCRNLLMRRVEAKNASNLLWLKLRPDTPQHYTYITVEEAKGTVRDFLHIHKWTQFYDLKSRTDLPPSRAEHVTMRRCEIVCDTKFNAPEQLEHCSFSDFAFEDNHVIAKAEGNTVWLQQS